MDDKIAVVAARTERIWEALTVLPASSLDGVSVRVEFPFGCEILGVYPSVSKAANTGKALPALDDLLVDLQLNQDTHFTSRFATQDSASQKTQCTLGAWRDTLLGARTTSIVIDTKTTGIATNSIVVTFSWKSPTVAAALFEDTTVGLAFNIRKVAQ